MQVQAPALVPVVVRALVESVPVQAEAVRALVEVALAQVWAQVLVQVQELVLVLAQELVSALGLELVQEQVLASVEAQHKHQAKPLARISLLIT